MRRHRRTGAHGQVQVGPIHRDVADQGADPLGTIALEDVIHVDVAPAAFPAIQDADAGRDALQVTHVPGVPGEALGASGAVVGPRGGTHLVSRRS